MPAIPSWVVATHLPLFAGLYDRTRFAVPPRNVAAAESDPSGAARHGAG
jgi:hypothetical protein